MKKFDAIIIGTGQAGKPLAMALAGEGWKTAIVEERFVGGTCINYGCTPTKAMIGSAKTAYTAMNSGIFGINTGKVSVDLKSVVARKNRIVSQFRNGSTDSLESSRNITLIKGTASFVDKETVKVAEKGSEQLLQSKTIIINTGAKPFIPQIEGKADSGYLTSETILDLKEIPKHLIILGGGYIALEFAQMFCRFGAKVTVVEKSEQFLPREDEDIAAEVRNLLEGEGIKILTGVNTKAIKRLSKNKLSLSLEQGGKARSLTGSHMLCAVGIKPTTDKLNLRFAGVKTDDKGYIKVNSKLETSAKGIYAAGDVKGEPAFTHIAYDDYRILFNNLTTQKKLTTSGRMVPYVLFTDPELARVGLTEAEALKQGYKIRKAVIPMTYSARGVESGETRGIMKAITDAKTGKILGCSILGTYAGEIMSMVQIAMMAGMQSQKLKDAVFAHPTLAETLNTLFSKLE
ncbi:MAG: mercuric reductase [Ignavibacteria bacterium]|nr:mercuric reductase [Ignavibacteria bacterium]